MGASYTSLLGIEARRIAVSFLSCLGSRASSLSSMLLSTHLMPSHVLLTATGVSPKQKKSLTTKTCILILQMQRTQKRPHDYQRCISGNHLSFVFVARPVAVEILSQIFNRYQIRFRPYKLLHAMAPRRVNNRNLRVILFSQALLLLLFQIYLALCPTTPPPLPPTITPLRVTATDKGVSAYATLVGPSNSPQSNHSASVVVVYVTLLSL